MSFSRRGGPSLGRIQAAVSDCESSSGFVHAQLVYGGVTFQVLHYLRDSNKALQWQIMLQGECDRRVISSVFREEKPLRLELQRKRLHQAVELTFDKSCVSTTRCPPTASCFHWHGRPHDFFPGEGKWWAQTRRAEVGWGFLGGAASPLPTSWGSGERCKHK